MPGSMRLASSLLAAILLIVLGPGASVQAQSAGSAGVPVTVVSPVREDVPVLARAIGTVQAFQSVLVRARVDGTLDKVLFTEGQQVRPGDLLAQLDPRPYQAALDQAVAKRAADAALLANARSELVRYADLAQSQAASRQRLELQRANVAQAEANVQGGNAAISAAQLNLDFTKITAPLEGRVGLRQIDPGNYIRAADPASSGIVTITQIHPIAALYTLPQDIMPQLQQAMQGGKLQVTAYSSDDRTELSKGELLTIDSAIDPSTGTIKLKAVFANGDDNLWPGQFVNLRTRLDTRRGALTLPSAAVQRGQDGLYVFVVRPDNTAALQPVEVGQDDGRVAVIDKGLNGGERVVLAGQSRLSVGASVVAAEAKPAS